MKRAVFPLLGVVLVLSLTCSNSTEPEASPPKLAVSTEDLTLTGTSRYDIIRIINVGGGTLSWTISEWPQWMSISSYSGSVTVDTLALRLSTDFGKLSYGSYEGTIKVTSNGGDATVKVRLTYSPPALKIDTPSLNFDRHFLYSELIIQNAGGGEVKWQIDVAPAWLVINPLGGSVFGRAEKVPLRVRLKDLSYGTYEDRIHINSNAGEYEIKVFLTFEREVEIFAGVGMANVRLGDTYTMVQNKLGVPDHNWYDRPEKTLFIHHFTYDELGLHFAVKNNSMILFGSGKVGYIAVQSPYDGMTEALIGIGSSGAEVQTAYGAPTRIVGNEWRYPGITFVMQNDAVAMIIIKATDF